MMRVHVDQDRCTGHARCHAVAPDAFPIDDAGVNVLKGQEIEGLPGLEDQYEAGAASCPERAIRIIR